MTTITRTFDVLKYAEENYNHKVALSVKRHGKWESFSTADYRKNVDEFSLGLLAMGFEKGDKIGIIRLSSRVDIYLPAKKTDVSFLNIDDKVYAGTSTIAKIR